MGGERALPMRWLVTMVVIAVAAAPSLAICPPGCRCNDDDLRASCVSASLQFVPIQLNPEVLHINLSDNKISSLHNMLSIYSSLITLDVSSNKLPKLEFANFIPHNLKYLNVSNNNIETLSKDSFKGLKSLCVLDLSNNKLRSVKSHSFKELHALQVLKLTGNRIDFLENNLFNSSRSLRELLLDDNQLSEIHSSVFSDAVNLQHLSLSKNLIASIDEGGIPNLPELRTLALAGNVINIIHPGALSGLTSLEYLDLSDNNITSVPSAALAKLSNLTKLKLSDNFITTVPPVAFKGLFQLRFLHLDTLELLNTIDARAFVDNINLESVYLDNNIALENIPTRLFHGNPHILYVSIQNNRLMSLEATHFPLDQLKRLRLGGNPFQCNCSLVWLWRLVQEQMAHKPNHTAELRNDLLIDVENLVCAGPEPLQHLPLQDATESQMGCSMGLVATISAVASGCLVLTIATVLLVKVCMKKREKRRELPPCPNGVPFAYEDPRVTKYVIGPPIRDFPGNLYLENGVPVSVDMYKQYTKARPHIVYV